tara:strand:+ start:1022 stop:1696 length:675 start_codon:yes stop_codon:yes gene_type:complete
MVETRTIEYDESYHNYITYRINKLKKDNTVNIDIKKDPYIIEITGTEPKNIHIEIQIYLIIIKPILNYIYEISINDINPIYHTNHRFITIITKLRNILYINKETSTILKDWDIEKEYDTNEYLLVSTNNINKHQISFKHLNTELDDTKTIIYLNWHKEQSKFLLNTITNRLEQVKLSYKKLADLEIKYNNYIIQLKEQLFNINVNFYDIYSDLESEYEHDSESD